VVLAALALVVSGCRADNSPTAAGAARPHAPICPKSWLAGWQKLANEIRAPVYCPSWLPQPLDGRFTGSPFNGHEVDRDRSYLVKFLWFDAGSAGAFSEVHVNLRGYPGSRRVPVCDDTLTVAGKTVHKSVPCFSDRAGTRRFGRTVATLYTANQGADQWHLLYAWHHRRSLYALSEHVVAPYSYKQVLANLDRMMRRLVLVEPNAQSKT